MILVRILLASMLIWGAIGPVCLGLFGGRFSRNVCSGGSSGPWDYAEMREHAPTTHILGNLTHFGANSRHFKANQNTVITSKPTKRIRLTLAKAGSAKRLQ